MKTMNYKKYVYPMALLMAFSCQEPSYQAAEPSTTPSTATGKVLITYAVPDAPVAGLYVDNKRIELLTPFGYTTSTSYLTVSAGGTRQIRVKTDDTPIAASNFSVTVNRTYTLFITDQMTRPADRDPAGPRTLLITDDVTPPTAGKAKVRFLHMAPDVKEKVELTNTTGNTSLLAIKKTVKNKAGESVDITNFQRRSYRSTSNSITIKDETLSSSVTDFENITAATYNLSIKSSGAAVKGLPVLFTYTFQAGKIYTVYLRGLSSGTGNQVPGYTVIQHN